MLGKEILLMILDWDRSEFTSYRSEQNLRVGEVDISRKSGDQSKNPFSNRQRVNNVSFPIFDFF